MRFCGKCGAAVKPDDRFCVRCGAPAEPEPATPPPDTSATPTVPPPGPPDAPVDPPGPPPYDPDAQQPAPPPGPSGPPPGAGPSIEPVPTVPPPSPSTTPATAPAAAPDRRVVLWGGVVAALIVLVVGIILFTRGNDNENATVQTLPDVTVSTPASDPIGETTIVASVDTTPATSEPSATTDETMLPTTTLAPTTLPPTTAAPETTMSVPEVPEVPAGWNSAEFLSQAYPPDFEGRTQGVPSPSITDPAAPLPDGVYSVRYLDRDATSLTLELHRFESCGVLGDEWCGEGPYNDDDLGVVNTPERIITLPLDSSIGVVLHGWLCGEAIGQGNGADLGEMYDAIVADYDVAFGAGLAAGTDPMVMTETVRSDPVARFGPPPTECDDGYSLQWQYDTAPPVLVQYAFDWDTGGALDPGTLFVPTALTVNGPDTTVWLYAGYYS